MQERSHLLAGYVWSLLRLRNQVLAIEVTCLHQQSLWDGTRLNLHQLLLHVAHILSLHKFWEYSQFWGSLGAVHAVDGAETQGSQRYSVIAQGLSWAVRARLGHWRHIALRASADQSSPLTLYFLRDGYCAIYLIVMNICWIPHDSKQQERHWKSPLICVKPDKFKQFLSFIHSLPVYLLSTKYVPGSVLGACKDLES